MTILGVIVLIIVVFLIIISESRADALYESKRLENERKARRGLEPWEDDDSWKGYC
jgi:hypothetical protein